ncbi:MAG TPA: CAP domain-containing protein [Flavobacterium sp.]|jgi:uncharacterized protein YkwD
MKLKVIKSCFMFAIVMLMGSCSAESEGIAAGDTTLVQDYNYNQAELALANQINDYRTSIGLSSLQTINHISYKSEEHNEYMIINNVVNHDYFEERSQNIIQVLGAVKVNENIAYNYTTAEGALHAWLESPAHKANIEGDFTHFGISISEDPETGKKYFTNIFIKK